MRRLAESFRRWRKPIIHVVRLYRPDGSKVDLCRRDDAERGKCVVLTGIGGAELVDELKPSPGVRLDAQGLLDGGLQQLGTLRVDHIQASLGTFYKTPLERHLCDLRTNITAVCGCNSPNCPRATIYEASERDGTTDRLRPGRDV